MLRGLVIATVTYGARLNTGLKPGGKLNSRSTAALGAL